MADGLEIERFEDGGLGIIRGALHPDGAELLEAECERFIRRPPMRASFLDTNNNGVRTRTITAADLPGRFPILRSVVDLVGNPPDSLLAVNEQPPHIEGNKHQDAISFLPVKVVHASPGGEFTFYPRNAEEPVSTPADAGDIFVQFDNRTEHLGSNLSDHTRYNVVISQPAPPLEWHLPRD